MALLSRSIGGPNFFSWFNAINLKTKYQLYGWNASAWRHVFVRLKPHIKALENITSQKLRIIEFGADRGSALTNELTELDASFVITCFKLEDVSSLRAAVIEENMEVTVRQADVLNFEGRYDLVLMKSVLGGVFRKNESKIDDVEALIEKSVPITLQAEEYLFLLIMESRS